MNNKFLGLIFAACIMFGGQANGYGEHDYALSSVEQCMASVIVGAIVAYAEYEKPFVAFLGVVDIFGILRSTSRSELGTLVAANLGVASGIALYKGAEKIIEEVKNIKRFEDE